MGRVLTQAPESGEEAANKRALEVLSARESRLLKVALQTGSSQRRCLPASAPVGAFVPPDWDQDNRAACCKGQCPDVAASGKIRSTKEAVAARLLRNADADRLTMSRTPRPPH